MLSFDKILAGGDLRSIDKSNAVLLKIKNQDDFDAIFECLSHTNRLVVMRAADVIEKITINNPNYLTKHKKKIIKYCDVVKDKELK